MALTRFMLITAGMLVAGPGGGGCLKRLQPPTLWWKPQIILRLHLFFEFSDGYSSGSSSRIEQQEGECMAIWILNVCAIDITLLCSLDWIVVLTCPGGVSVMWPLSRAGAEVRDHHQQQQRPSLSIRGNELYFSGARDLTTFPSHRDPWAQCHQ